MQPPDTFSLLTLGRRQSHSLQMSMKPFNSRLSENTEPCAGLSFEPIYSQVVLDVSLCSCFSERYTKAAILHQAACMTGKGVVSDWPQGPEWASFNTTLLKMQRFVAVWHLFSGRESTLNTHTYNVSSTLALKSSTKQFQIVLLMPFAYYWRLCRFGSSKCVLNCPKRNQPLFPRFCWVMLCFQGRFHLLKPFCSCDQKNSVKSLNSCLISICSQKWFLMPWRTDTVRHRRDILNLPWVESRFRFHEIQCLISVQLTPHDFLWLFGWILK